MCKICIYKPARERLRAKRKHKIIKQQHTAHTHTRRHQAHQEHFFFFFRKKKGEKKDSIRIHLDTSPFLSRRGRVPVVSGLRGSRQVAKSKVNALLHDKKKVVALSAGDYSKFTHSTEPNTHTREEEEEETHARGKRVADHLGEGGRERERDHAVHVLPEVRAGDAGEQRFAVESLRTTGGVDFVGGVVVERGWIDDDDDVRGE